MNSRSLLLLWLVALSLSAACDRQPRAAATPRTEAMVQSSGSELQARLEAATRISALTARDDALRQVAVDAAKAKESQTSKEALAQISNMSTKDRTAEECALSLARAGQAGAASELAQMISSHDLRDKTLAAIAKGQ